MGRLMFIGLVFLLIGLWRRNVALPPPICVHPNDNDSKPDDDEDSDDGSPNSTLRNLHATLEKEKYS